MSTAGSERRREGGGRRAESGERRAEGRGHRRRAPAEGVHCAGRCDGGRHCAVLWYSQVR